MCGGGCRRSVKVISEFGGGGPKSGKGGETGRTVWSF